MIHPTPKGKPNSFLAGPDPHSVRPMQVTQGSRFARGWGTYRLDTAPRYIEQYSSARDLRDAIIMVFDSAKKLGEVQFIGLPIWYRSQH